MAVRRVTGLFHAYGAFITVSSQNLIRKQHMKAGLTLCFALVTIMCSSLPAVADVVLDQGFDPGTGANGLVESTVVQPDGKILICGNFSSFNNTSHAYIARLHPDGTIDESFRADVGYWVRHMALQSDGKIVIGGFFTDVQGVPRNRIARLNANGSLDTTFNPGTGCRFKIVPPDPWEPFVFAVAVQPDGKIIIGGNFVTYNGVTNTGIVRVNSNGSLDTTFNVGAGVNSWVRSLLVQPDGKIMVTGWFTSYNNQNHSRMVLLNPDGSADPLFNPDFGDLTAVYTVAQVDAGKYIVAGHSANTNNPGYWGREMARLNPDGSFDKSFLGYANEKVESIRVQPDGKIVMGGYFSAVNGTPRWNLARLNSDGSLDDSFAPQTDNFVWTVALQSDGKILATGGFSSVNGVSRKGISRFGNSSEVDTTPPLTLITQTPDSRTAVLKGSSSFTRTLLNSGKALNPRNHIAVINDFNHDGKGDFVWQQNVTGAVWIWFMNGTNVLQTATLNGQPSARGWRVAASADFNGDGENDLVLQKGVNLNFWFLNGTNVDHTVTITRPMAAAWRVVGAGDFNNDGQQDLVWQHLAGYLAVSHLNATNVSDSIVLKKKLAAGYGVRVVKDFSGDGQPDLLLQNGGGIMAVWNMSNTNFVSANAHGRVVPAWRVVGTN